MVNTENANDYMYSMERDKDTLSSQVLTSINNSISRCNFDGEFYETASFKVNGIDYLMSFPGVLYKFVWGRGYTLVKGSPAKRGIYREYIIDGARIKSYVLSLLCLTDWFYDKYMSDRSLVVNHCVVGEYYDSHGKYVTAPYQSLVSDVRYLEVVSYSKNVKHGKFVDKNELFGLYVSADDVDALEEIFREHNYENIQSDVIEFYKDKKFDICFN